MFTKLQNFSGLVQFLVIKDQSITIIILCCYIFYPVCNVFLRNELNIGVVLLIVYLKTSRVEQTLCIDLLKRYV